MVLKKWSHIFLPFKGSQLQFSQKKVNQTKVKWKHPHGFFKLNFDGSNRGKMGISRARIVIRYYRRMVLTTKSIKL